MEDETRTETKAADTEAWLDKLGEQIRRLSQLDSALEYFCDRGIELPLKTLKAIRFDTLDICAGLIDAKRALKEALQ